jgi:AraC family transcriptional regulator
MHVYVGHAIIERAAAEILGNGHGPVAFREISGQQDNVLSTLLAAVRSEITGRHTSSGLSIAGLAQSLALHLVRSDRDGVAPHFMRGVLPASRLRRVVDLMESQRRYDLNLIQFAQEAGMSAFHFSRLFKKSTGLASSQYFIGLRMAEARRMLRKTKRSIIDIGLDVGHTSPSHFAQVFSRKTGISPSEYRGR